MNSKDSQGGRGKERKEKGSEKLALDILKVTGKARYCRDLFPANRESQSQEVSPSRRPSTDEGLRRSHLKLIMPGVRPPTDIESLHVPGVFKSVGVVLSPVRSGVIEAFKREVIQRVEGVTCLTYEDIPGDNCLTGKLNTQFLAEKEIRYLGHPIALVIAESPSALESALRAAYGEALVVREHSRVERFPEDFRDSKIPAFIEREVRIGNVDRQGQSNEVTVEAATIFPSVDPMTIEAEGGYAWKEEDCLHIQCSGSNGDLYRSWISRLLKIPVEKVVWHGVLQGGNYGSREYTIVPLILAASAWLSDSPVSWFVDEHAKRLLTKSGFAVACDLKLSWQPDGGKLALQGRVFVDLGSHFEQEEAVCERITQTMLSVYRFDSVNVDIEAYMTSSGPHGIIKGSGQTGVTSTLEGLVSRLADRLGEDPISFRQALLKEAEKAGQEILRRMKRIQSDGRVPVAFQPVEGSDEGAGLASGVYGSAIGVAVHNQIMPLERTKSPTKVELVFDKHGSFLIRLFGEPLTEGQKQALRRIAQEVLKAPMEMIRVEMVLDSSGRSGQEFRKNLYLSSNAVFKASHLMLAKLYELGSLAIGTREDDLLIEGGYLSRRNGSDKLSIKELGFRYGDFKIETTFQSDRTGLSRFTGALASVRINRMSGEITVHDLTLFIDAGRILEWDLFEAQLQGAVNWAMGILFRRRIKGDYLEVPSVYDTPESVKFVVVSDPDEGSDGSGRAGDPFVVKGTGEGPQAVAVAAILNAVGSIVGKPIGSLPIDLIQESCQMAYDM